MDNLILLLSSISVREAQHSEFDGILVESDHNFISQQLPMNSELDTTTQQNRGCRFLHSAGG